MSTKKPSFLRGLYSRYSTFFLSLFIFVSLLGLSWTIRQLSFESCSIQQNAPATVNTQVTFSISCTNTTLPRVAWDFGDGSGLGPYTNQSSATHTYTTTGTFHVFARLEGDETPLTTVQVVVDPIPANRPTHSSTIIHDAVNGLVWNVNADNNTVSALNDNTLAKMFEVAVGTHPRTLSLQKNGDVWVANEDNATITVLNKNGGLVRTITLPYASRPYGICTDPQGNNVFVTLNATGKLLRFNATTGQQTGELSVGVSPRGIAITSDGARVLVTRFISPTTQGEISEVNASAMTLTRVFPLAFDNTPDFEDKGRGVPNYISSVTIAPSGKFALIPSKKDNTVRGQFRDGLALTFESTVRTITSRINLQTNQEELNKRIDINDADMANAIAFSPYGNLAFVALQGNNKVHIRDVNSNAVIGEIKETGLAPQGLVFNTDGSKLFVQNFMSRTVKVYNTRDMILGKGFSAAELANVSVVATEKLSAQVLKGKQIFYNAEDKRMTSAGYISCASCHLDGGSDQRVWDFTDRGEGFRKTIVLNGRRGTGMGNVHWTGNFDEIHDFENDIRNSFKGTGFMSNADYTATQNPLGPKKAGRSADLDALVAYVNSLNRVHTSPHTNAGALTADAVSGRTIFNNLGCATCHAGSDFTDRKTGTLHNVGTISTSSGKRNNQTLTGFMTPTLKGIWETAPYLHDGSAPTLRDVLITKNASGQHGNTSSLTNTQLNQLIAYLNQLDDINACTDQSITATAVPDKLTNSPAFNLSATASSGLPVAYSVIAGPATVSGNTVTLTGTAGTVIVAVNQAGNATFCNAPQITIPINVISECAGVTTGIYKLINKGSGKALDNNGSLNNGTAIVQRTDNASANANQQWTISATTDGYFKIINRSNLKALDNNGSTTSGSAIVQNADNAATNNNQQWSLCKLSNGAYRVVSRRSSMVLDNSGASQNENNAIVQGNNNSATAANQQWDIVPVTESVFTSGIYKVTARHSGKALNVASASTSDNAQVDQSDYTGGAHQKWKIEHTGNGYYTITAVHSEKSLQQPDSLQADNAFIFQRATARKAHQLWVIRDVGNGYFELVAKHSGKTMAVTGAGTANGTRIVQLGSGGATHQQWRLERLEVPQGPGLGNLQYNPNEVFSNIWLYSDPTHYGSNIAIMHNGYLVTTYTPDSGRPPGGIMIWNVSNPRAPVLVNKIFDSRTQSLREAHSIGQHGNYIALQEGCGIQIWDLSDVMNPVLVKQFCIPGYSHDDYGAAWQLFWQAPYIYIANGAQGLDVVDATDVRNPVYVKHVNIGMQVGPIFAIGNLLVTGAHNVGRGFAVLDISDPRNPKLTSSINSSPNQYSAFVNGNRMIGSSRSSSNDEVFHVYDFTNPQNIQLAGQVDINVSGQLYCSTQDQYIFQGCESQIVKIDATNVANMTVVGSGSLNIIGDSDHGQVTPMGNLVFVGNDHGTGNGFIVHQQAPDTRGPEVNMVSPTNGAINRGLTTRIGMTFTDNVDLRTANTSTFIVRPLGGTALSGSFSHQFSILNFSPDQPLLPNTTYEIILPAGGLKDWSGNSIPTTFTSVFSTGSVINNCVPTHITPYTMIVGEDWQSVSSATVDPGMSVMFGPHPTEGGSWSWSGPNGFLSTSREISINNIQANTVGNYVATYTDVEGCISQRTFVIALQGNRLPTVSVTAPAHNSLYTAPANIVLNASASDYLGTVTKVEFYNGATKLGEDLSAPYSFNWNSVAAGLYTVTAVATDNENGVTTSTPIEVVVNNSGNPLPVVSISSPSNGTSFGENPTITINAEATDAHGIAKVEFFRGSVKLGEDLTAPYSYVWSNVQNGVYALTARATDNQGGIGASVATNIEVKCTPTSINPYWQVYNGPDVWFNNLTVSIDAGSSLRFGPQGGNGGSWSWTGPNGYTSTDREAIVNNLQPNMAGNYIARYTNQQGCVAQAIFAVAVTSSGNQSPQVNITAPANNTNFAAPASINITATASDANGSVTKVEFFNGSTKLGEDATAPYSYNWTNVAAGTYTILARATDNGGATGISAAVNTVVGTCSPVFLNPYWQVYNGPDVWFNNLTVSINAGSSLRFGPQGPEGTWSWTGPNGYTSTDREAIVNNMQSNMTGNYVVRHTSPLGCISQATFVVTLNSQNQLPQVSITSPVNNASFLAPASITIAANATDGDGTITKVEFFNGATKLGEDLTTPYSFTWSNVAAGNYAITARATDNNGAVTTSAVVNVISRVNQLPAVSITSPANNASFVAPATITISAAASDADGSIAKVEFYNGTTKLGEDLSAPYSYTWNNVAAGNYAITARATDNEGGVTTSTGINVSSGINQSPTVSITSPTNNATFTAPASVAIAATAGDNDGSVTKVEFFNGATKLGEDLTTPYSYTWANVAVGTYALTARATDNNGAVTNSSVINITVQNQLPTVTITSPANNASFLAPASITISANATDNNGTITKVEFFNGATKLGEDLTTPYSFTWTNVAAGTYTITARATDNNGGVTNSAVVNVVSRVNQLPTVSITSPANNASFTAPASITISANASDGDGNVAKVEFFNGATKLGEDISSPYSYAWTNVAAANYSLTARATDNNGGITNSSVIQITVMNGGDACASVPQYSAAGGYAAGSMVKNGGNKYECKEWPYSGWCNGAASAYEPGVGTNWADAWYLRGSCSSQARITGENESEINSLRVIPNPASGFITLSLGNDFPDTHYTIINIYGNVSMEGKLEESGETSIDISSLPPGSYQIHVRNTDQVWTQSLIVY